MPLFTMPKIKISRRIKIILGILITISAAVLIFLFFWSAWNNMFQQNERFLLTHFSVVSADGEGWWHGKEDQVLKHLAMPGKEPEDAIRIVEGVTNLFSLDLEKIRKKLELVPEIEQAKVSRILPNTLHIKITERTPAAAIGSRQSFFLADQNGVVIRRSRSLKITGSLPVIYGFKRGVPAPGKTFEDLLPALEFIRLSRTAYGELNIVMINVASEDYLVMRLFFKENRMDYYDVWVPVKKAENGMDRILTSIYEIKKMGINRRNIDLRYENQTILRASREGKR